MYTDTSMDILYPYTERIWPHIPHTPMHNEQKTPQTNKILCIT